MDIHYGRSVYVPLDESRRADWRNWREVQEEGERQGGYPIWRKEIERVPQVLAKGQRAEGYDETLQRRERDVAEWACCLTIVTGH